MVVVSGVIILLIAVLGIAYCGRSHEGAGRAKRADTVTASVAQGALRGRLDRTARNNEYRYFLGVPFGEPPLGARRFKDPVAASYWAGEYNALKRKPICFQLDGETYAGSEDCLYLDVHTPAPIPGLLRPVLFFIYGGGFAGGSSRTVGRPEVFIDEGVIVVAANHRLGPFGFLSLNTPEVPGNAALKDQVLALRWVRNNIQNFGGDPNNIAVGGHDSGAASATFLQMSGLTRNLFHKNIILGESALIARNIQRNPVDNAKLIGDILGFDTSNTNLFLEQLQSVPASDILWASSGMNPTIEPVFEGVHSYLTKEPRQYLESGDFAHMPVIIGYCSKEAAGSFNTNDFNASVYDPYFLVPDEWSVENTGLLTEAADKIRDFYFGTQVYQPHDREMQMEAVEYLSDQYAIEIRDVAEMMSRGSPEPVYYFRFSYRGGLNAPAIDQLGVQGATHGDERRYIFPPVETLQDAYSSDEWVSRRLGRLLANFMKTGNPTPGPDSMRVSVKWSPVTRDTVHYLNVDSELTPSEDPDGGRIQFWKNLRKYFDGRTQKNLK